MKNLMILDLDGTLIDSRKDIANSLNYALKAQGFPTLSQSHIESLVGWGAKQLVSEAIGDPSDEALERVFVSFWKHYEGHLLDKTEVYPQALDFLKATPLWRKALVTNKPELFTRKILHGLGLESYFEWVIGGDTLAVQKPNPKVFQPIVSVFTDPEKTVMIGDSAIDIDCGRAAGMTTLALAHGFCPRGDLESAKPDFLVENFDELAQLSIFSE